MLMNNHVDEHLCKNSDANNTLRYSFAGAFENKNFV